MPAPQSGSPMTYRLNGEQYIVLAISAPNVPGRTDGIQAATGATTGKLSKTA